MILIDNVTTGIFSPSTDFSDIASVGLWHNHFVYLTLQRIQRWGSSDPDLSVYISSINTQTAQLESLHILPSGSGAVVTSITNILNAGYSNFPQVINALAQVHQNTINNANYANTPLAVITGISYNSPVLLSQVIDGSTGQPLPMAKWLKRVCADIVGAIGGIGTEGFLGGLVSAVIGGVIGAACGTVAGWDQ